jgi:hypothetical protein
MIKHKIKVGNKQVVINGDFRAILALDKIEDSSARLLKFYAGDSKLKQILIAFKFKKHITDYIKAMVDYIQCGNSSGEHHDRVIDYDKDWDLICSAFMHDYRIDLTIDKVEWQKFISLLNGMNETNMISKIIGYRGCDLSKVKDKETRKFYSEMKEKFALDADEELESDEEAVKRALRERNAR